MREYPMRQIDSDMPIPKDNERWFNLAVVEKYGQFMFDQEAPNAFDQALLMIALFDGHCVSDTFKGDSVYIIYLCHRSFIEDCKANNYPIDGKFSAAGLSWFERWYTYYDNLLSIYRKIKEFSRDKSIPYRPIVLWPGMDNIKYLDHYRDMRVDRHSAYRRIIFALADYLLWYKYVYPKVLKREPIDSLGSVNILRDSLETKVYFTDGIYEDRNEHLKRVLAVANLDGWESMDVSKIKLNSFYPVILRHRSTGIFGCLDDFDYHLNWPRMYPLFIKYRNKFSSDCKYRLCYYSSIMAFNLLSKFALSVEKASENFLDAILVDDDYPITESSRLYVPIGLHLQVNDVEQLKIEQGLENDFKVFWLAMQGFDKLSIASLFINDGEK